MTSRARLLHDLARGVALAAALFVVLLGGLLVWNQIRGKVPALVNSREVTRLHEELRRQPKNEELKQRIRQLDLQLRRDTFYRLQLSHYGSRALLVGVALFLGAAHLVRVQRRRPPDPLAWGARKPEAETRGQAHTRYGLAGTAAVLALLALQASLRPLALPEPPPPATKGAAPAVPAFPTFAELQAQWPTFRGPEGAGVAPDAEAPLAWNGTNGLNVRWKTEIPMPGMSSPIVWSNALFLTGADGKSNRVMCFDTESGALRWTAGVQVPVAAGAEPQVSEDTGFAAPTAATDGRRVYAIFPNGEIAAFDYAGKQVWARNIGPLENSYGYASSLALHQDRLLVQIDRGSADENLSHMLALDTRTGREVWRVPRAVGGSWASPVVRQIEGEPHLLTCGPPWFIDYDPADGRVRWQVKCLESDVAPSPVFGSNMLVVVAPNNAILGLRLGATGETWRAEDGVPDATSPVIVGARVFILSSEGLLTCYDVQTGKPVWQHEFDDHFYASPTLAGRTLILLGRKGAGYLLEAGDERKELGRSELGEACNASPAPIGKRLYIRGQKHLFCIEEAEKK